MEGDLPGNRPPKGLHFTDQLNHLGKRFFRHLSQNISGSPVHGSNPMVLINGNKTCRHILYNIIGKGLYTGQGCFGRPIGLESKKTDHTNAASDKEQYSPANCFPDQAFLGQACLGHGNPCKYIVFCYRGKFPVRACHG